MNTITITLKNGVTVRVAGLDYIEINPDLSINHCSVNGRLVNRYDWSDISTIEADTKVFGKKVIK